MVIEHVHVTIENGEIAESEIKHYIHRIHRNAKGKKLKKLELKVGPDHINMRYAFHAFPFERICRVNTTRPNAQEFVS